MFRIVLRRCFISTKPCITLITDPKKGGDSLFINKTRNYTTTVTSNPEPVKIKISESCVKRLKELEGTKQYLRISVDSGGCSGFEYKFSIENQINADDKVIEKEGAKIIVDTETLEYIEGATIDHYEELIRTGFRVIDNPKADHGCSCGSSFSIKI